MAHVRGQERLVYESVNDYLSSQLTSLGWIDDTIDGTSVFGPFAATRSVTLLDRIPDKTSTVEVNSVAFTSGKDQPDTAGELGAAGGGLWLTEHVFHVDIWGETQGIARALQSDIRAMCTGRLAGSSRYIPFTDKTQNPPQALSDHLLHFEDVESDTPLDQAYKLEWRVVHLTVVHEYNAVEVPM